MDIMDSLVIQRVLPMSEHGILTLIIPNNSKSLPGQANTEVPLKPLSYF